MNEILKIRELFAQQTAVCSEPALTEIVDANFDETTTEEHHRLTKYVKWLEKRMLVRDEAELMHDGKFFKMTPEIPESPDCCFGCAFYKKNDQPCDKPRKFPDCNYEIFVEL